MCLFCETGFAFSFSETVSSIYKTETSFGESGETAVYLGPMKPQKFERIVIKVMT